MHSRTRILKMQLNSKNLKIGMLAFHKKRKQVAVIIEEMGSNGFVKVLTASGIKSFHMSNLMIRENNNGFKTNKDSWA